MKCYDCLQNAHQETASVGVCSRCGAAACENHARVRNEPVSRVNGMGRTHGTHFARKVVCHSCEPALSAR